VIAEACTAEDRFDTATAPTWQDTLRSAIDSHGGHRLLEYRVELPAQALRAAHDSGDPAAQYAVAVLCRSVGRRRTPSGRDGRWLSPPGRRRRPRRGLR
jgi:hypothetical protein